MSNREIPGAVYNQKTKNKILNEATCMFARKGYGEVTMRDLGKEVGIKMSTIYHYFPSKEALFEEVMQRFENGYKHYFEWLQGENKNAETLEEVMDNMFKEVFDIVDPIGRLGISIAAREQHSNESARKRVFDMLYVFSVKCIKEDFDNLIVKGVIAPTDTKMIATIFVNNIWIINDLSIHEYNGTKIPVNYKEMYNDLRKCITCLLRSGE